MDKYINFAPQLTSLSNKELYELAGEIFTELGNRQGQTSPLVGNVVAVTQGQVGRIARTAA